MPRVSTVSNPTGLVEIDRKRLSVFLNESNGEKTFSLTRLDLSGLALQPPLTVAVIARRGNSEQRIELGNAWDWDKSFRKLTEVADEGHWIFRVLLTPPNTARLAASAENVRPDGQDQSTSFIALEAAELDQVPWEVVVLEQEGRAIIRFNRLLYLSPAAAEADTIFMCLVLPEAVRAVSTFIAQNFGALEEEAWRPFGEWLVLHGITEEPDPGSSESLEAWTKSIVRAFCDRFSFTTKIQESKVKGADE